MRSKFFCMYWEFHLYFMIFPPSSMNNLHLTKLKVPSGLSQLHTGREFTSKNCIMKWGCTAKILVSTTNEKIASISSLRNLDLCRLDGESKEFKLLDLLNSI